MSTAARPSPASFIKHATDVASFYGFRSMRDIERTVPRIDRTRGTHSFATATHVCGACFTQKPLEPVLGFYATPSPSHLPSHYVPRETAEFGLNVAGSPESIGEVLLLKTAHAIITEWGGTVARLRVNALGDRDSKLRFERELSIYLRKHAAELDEGCRASFADHPIAAYTCQSEVCRAILQDGPRAMNFLSEKSRSHFREVLEHIEKLRLPYEIDDLLMGDDRDPHTLFALDLTEEGDATVFGGVGGRYDDYVRRITNKKEGACVSASIFFRKKGAERSNFTSPRASAMPKMYFVQLGLRAKLQGLAVLDVLRQQHIPVSQSFDSKSLTTQLACARQLGVPYLLIMGQREALDGTIIVRSMRNSSQTIVELAQLPRFLKGIKM